jgi:hypothetical protein
MGFFESLPPPVTLDEPPQPPLPRWHKPEDVLGGVVTEQLILTRSAKVAMAISTITGYPTGFDFALVTVLRDEDRYGRFWHHGFHRTGRPDEPLPEELLRFGLRFADGRTATNLGTGLPPDHEADPAGPVLMSSGGGGGGRYFSQRYWVWPLPPAGPLSFFCEWPALDVPETRVDFDAQLILDAAVRAVDLRPAAG